MRELVKDRLRRIKDRYDHYPSEHRPLGKYHQDLEKFLIYGTDRQLLDLLCSATTDIAK